MGILSAVKSAGKKLFGAIKSGVSEVRSSSGKRGGLVQSLGKVKQFYERHVVISPENFNFDFDFDFGFDFGGGGSGSSSYDDLVGGILGFGGSPRRRSTKRKSRRKRKGRRRKRRRG